jgi:hypothetical protein
MRNKTTGILIAALLTLPAGAQNLNPQVQVTNDYKAELGTTGKKSVAMEIPDSLTLFRTSVSYDVFTTPYRGAYEFSPYEISVTPKKPASDRSKLYVRAGAGYTLHPELDVVWSPVVPFPQASLSVFDHFSGYSGKYRSLDGRAYSGYDWLQNAGVSGYWFGRSFTLGCGFDYNGIYNSDFDGHSSFHDVAVNGNISSDPNARLVYAFALKVNQTFDPVVMMTGINAGGSVYPNWMLPFDLRLDFSVESDFYEKGPYGNVFVAQISPKALYEFGPASIAAGVTLSPAMDIQWLYPDVMVTVNFLDDAMQAYALVKGGQYARSYTDLKLADHWFNSDYTAAMKSTLERLNAGVGVRGCTLKNLQYDLSGGWASYSDAPLQSLKADAANPGLLKSGITYADYNLWYAALDAVWKSHRLDAGLKLRFSHTDTAPNDNYLDLPLLSGAADVTYNWNSRIYAGIWCEARTSCAAQTYPVPGFVNLGLKGEFRFNSMLGAWTKVGNILNRRIAWSPLHVEDGVYFTAGISYNMK